MSSSQSSHTTDSKNKNLLAAKASLGLSTAGSTSSSRRNEPTKSTSLHSVSSSVASGSTLHSNELSQKYPGSAQEEARRFSSNLSAASSSYRSNTPAKSTSLHSVSSSVSGGSSRKFPASAQEDAQRFTSSLHTDNDSYASSRYGQHLPTSQQIDETIEVGSVDDSMAGDSMIGGSSTYSTASNNDKMKKKSKRNNNAARDSDGNKITSTLESNSSLFTSQSSTSEFSTSFDNCYEKKVEYNEYETSLQSIQEDAQSIEEAHPVLHDSNANMSESGSDFYDSYAHSSQRSDFYDSNADISERSELEDSNNNLSERSELDYSNANLSQRSDLYESNGDISQRSDGTQSHMSRDDFTPQRFDEMRTLLSAITPLQLEALMQEIFGKDGPPGWRFIGKKSKTKGFRKDAYLSEMSIEELQNFARRMDNLGLDYCTSNEEALDVIAIEFERLVTLHQNKDEESIRADSMQPQNSMNSTMNSMMSSNLMEDDQMTLDSGRTSRSDEPDNLRRSLRACSFPELRLVAERLNLDHSSCVTKGELIYMIENSMPDLVDATSQDSQSQMLLEDYNNYSEPAPRNSRDRRRKVKFSNDCKEDKSHLVSKRGSWQDNGQDIESSPLVNNDGDKESSRFMVVFKRVRKAVAVLLLLALIIGLSVGLTAGKGGNVKKGGSSDALMPQNDPFWDFFGSSRTSEPSLSPSSQNTDDESQPTSHNQGKPSSPSGGVVIIKRDPTAKPSVYSTQEFYKGSHMPTETDITQLPSASQNKQPTLNPTRASLIETEKPIPVAQFSITNDQPMTTDPPITTAQPTPLSPYPLLGPFEETDMRMVVYGISELSQMGKTQFKMLTAAYVEQFYNEEGRGTDAIQNIVFDVAASIDITSVDPPPSRRLTRSRIRALQADILIITFTMNLSYKTFSNAVDAKTVAERPFLEESMIDDYIEFLDENNAQKFVGNIEDVSSIFRGNDFPEIYYDVGGEENVIDNTKAPSPRPTMENTPEPSRKPTAKPIQAVVTPKPTLLVTPSPTERPIVSPTLSPTDKPTQSPTRKPTNKPTPGKVIHTYSPVKQVIHTYSPVAFRRMEEVQDSVES